MIPLEKQLQSIDKDATIEECQQALKEMTFEQAVQYFKKRNLRKTNIEYFKQFFPNKSDVKINKILDESNDDFDLALIALAS